MTPPTSSHKALLMISALVLLAHMVLLRATPIGLRAATADQAPVYFTTNMVAAATQAQAQPQPVRPPGKLIRKITPQVVEQAAVSKVPAVPEAAALPTQADNATPHPPLPDAPALAVANAMAPDPLPPRPAKPAQQSASATSMPQDPASTSSVVATAQGISKGPSASSQPVLRVSSEELPGSVKLLYKVESNKFPYKLNAEFLWTQKDAHYAASLQVGAFGQYRIQSSRGSIAHGGLVPERFSDKYRSEVAAHFNWPQAKVTFSANTPDVALQEGAQDRMSVLIQIGALLATAPAQRAPGTQITLQTVGPRDADAWLFTVGESEELAVPSDPPDTVQAIKVTRKPRQLYDQQMELWLAPTLNYLPARIRLLEANGNFVDQMWFATVPVESP